MQADYRIDWVILAGGFGTRSANPSLPKVLQKVGGNTLLSRHLGNVAAFGPSRVILVLHHGANQVKAAIEVESSNYPLLDIVAVEDAGVGVLPALELGLSHCKSQTVGLILGDTYINADLQRLVSSWRFSGRKLGVVGRVSDHLFDSDSVSVNYELNIVTYSPKGLASSKDGHLFGLTGLAFFDRGALKLDLAESTDAIPAILDAIGVSDCAFVPAIGHFGDTGTLERLTSLEKLDASLAKGSDRTVSGGALFFDRDNTVVVDEPSGRGSVVREDLNMRLVSSLAAASRRGISLHMVSNQPSIAKGWTTFETTYEVNNQLAALLLSEGVKVSTMQFCPHHPESGYDGEVLKLKIPCECRKPGTGMFLKAAKLASIDLQKSIMVGDALVDEQAARTLKMDYQSIVWGDRHARLSALEAWIDSH